VVTPGLDMLRELSERHPYQTVRSTHEFDFLVGLQYDRFAIH